MRGLDVHATTTAVAVATRLDYVTEVEHGRDRIEWLERSIDTAVEAAPGLLIWNDPSTVLRGKDGSSRGGPLPPPPSQEFAMHADHRFQATSAVALGVLQGQAEAPHPRRRSAMALRVLVVEDEEDVAALFEDMLRELGHEPVLVRSAEAARLALTIEHADVILLDLRLPLMSGLDFLHLGPPGEPGIPVIAVSGVATEAEARESLRRGALDFLSKPVSGELLREVLRYAEARGLSDRLDATGRPIDRRRSRRATVATPVRVTVGSGPVWEGACVDLSTFGIRVARPHAPGRPLGLVARLVFALPGSGPTLDLLSVVVRRERDAYVFRFVNLMEVELRRLRDTVGRLTAEHR